jgi:hypothetical protein
MKLLLLSLVSAAALWSASCGGGGGSVATPPPPVGGFTNASLSGQYAFVTNGEVFANGAAAPTPVARTGSFMADGSGNITGGVEDVVEPNALPNLAVPITGGSYTVNADGRGTLTLNVASGGVPSSINFGIVLTSTSDGLLIDETSTAAQASTGSGNFFKQDTTAFTNPVLPTTATYVFDFSGEDANMFPASFVGKFTAGNGAITAGVEDVNDAFVLTGSAIIPPGTLTLDPANTSFGRGTTVIAGENYVFYIVDSTRIRFISTGGAMFTGDAVIQDNTIPTSVSSINSGFAFIVSGTTAVGGLTRVGRLTATGSSVSNVLVDTNSAGTFTPTTGATAATIALDPANPGRGTLTFLGNNLQTPFIFVFYLTSATQGVIQETTLSGGAPIAVADGALAAQSGSPFSSSNITGTYAVNWSGQSLQSGTPEEEDLVGQVKASSLNLTGAADIFQFTALAAQTNVIVGGSVMIGGDGTGGSGARNAMTVMLTSSSSTTVNFVVYFVNPQLAFIANNNQTTNRIVVGVLKAQTTP